LHHLAFLFVRQLKILINPKNRFFYLKSPFLGYFSPIKGSIIYLF
jgi:hypothetical protein